MGAIFCEPQSAISSWPGDVRCLQNWVINWVDDGLDPDRRQAMIPILDIYIVCIFCKLSGPPFTNMV